MDVKSSKSKTTHLVNLRFQITQHIRDERLIGSFVTYFECGRVVIEKSSAEKGGAARFLVTRFLDNNEKIIPFFQRHILRGVKFDNFQDFIKVGELMKAKDHLTPDGLEQIRVIKANMNKGRKSYEFL